ncbi:MAG: DUF2189 domain-containing protein [Candidatus Thiodiazotropha lotti]|nr:DUF2189 domain-containing protein [Candidatus Thiodiazotropha lotti]
MDTTYSDTLNKSRTPEILSLSQRAPYEWLRNGWQDFRHATSPSLTLGFFIVVAGYALVSASWTIPLLSLTFITGFLLVAPVFALGFYEISKRIQQGESVGFKSLTYSWKNHGWSVLLFGLILGLVMVAWGRLTGLLVALSLPTFGPFNDLLSWQALTDPGFIVLYTVVGFALAALIFSISVVSIPMLVERKIDVLTAAMTSLRVVQKNPGVMFRWAFIIALLTILGMFTAFIGLLIIMPVLGHASWHAYKAAVAD